MGLSKQLFKFFSTELKKALSYDKDLKVEVDEEKRHIYVRETDSETIYGTTLRTIMSALPERYFSFYVSEGKIVIYCK